MLIVHVLVFCFATTLTEGALSTKCPDESQYRPCYCGHYERGITLNCNHKSQNDIRRILDNMKNHDISSFSFKDFRSTIPVPGDLFHGMTIHELWITESQFSFATDQLPFDGLQDLLTKLIFRDSQVGFPGIPLNHLNKFVVLLVQSIEIKTLKEEWVRQWPEHLEFLMMIGCRIENLEPQALKSLAQLGHLDLRNNEISNFERTMLADQLPELLKLFMDNNRLTHLDKHMFDGMPKLLIVSFQGNRISSMLYYPTWYQVWERLMKVNMEDNPLDCSNDDILYFCGTKRPRSIRGSCISPEYVTGVQFGSHEFCRNLVIVPPD